MFLLAVTLQACGDGGEQAQSTPSSSSESTAPSVTSEPPTATPAPTCPGRPSTEITLRVRHIAFPVECLLVPAGEPWRIDLVNQTEVNHNVAIETSESEAVFIGELAYPGDAIAYRIEPLDAGVYVFQCDIHPKDMTGTLVVE
ncbi:MAG: cupredoxin domain-containing protein [Actinomycetota bacterium]